MTSKMKDLCSTFGEQKGETILGFGTDLPYLFEKLEAEKSCAIYENIALKSKVALLESQLKSREETIRLQTEQFENEKKALKNRYQLEHIRQRPSVIRHQAFAYNAEQANMKSITGNSKVIKIEPQSWVLPPTNLPKLELSSALVSPPRPTFVLQKKRKKVISNYMEYTLPRRKKVKVSVRASKNVKSPNRQKKAAPKSVPKNFPRVNVKAQIMQCFNQLQERTGNVQDVYRLMEQFGNKNRSAIRANVSQLVSKGKLEKLPRGEHQLNPYQAPKVKKDT